MESESRAEPHGEAVVMQLKQVGPQEEVEEEEDTGLQWEVQIAVVAVSSTEAMHGVVELIPANSCGNIPRWK